MNATPSAPRTREDLVAEYRRLSRALADEHQPESDARALRRALEQVQAEIDVLDAC
jgi:hypothetical protein